MSNHFHIFVYVPKAEEIDEAEKCINTTVSISSDPFGLLLWLEKVART